MHVILLFYMNENNNMNAILIKHAVVEYRRFRRWRDRGVSYGKNNSRIYKQIKWRNKK